MPSVRKLTLSLTITWENLQTSYLDLQTNFNPYVLSKTFQTTALPIGGIMAWKPPLEKRQPGVKSFVHKYKHSHDKRRKFFRRAHRDGLCTRKYIENENGWLYTWTGPPKKPKQQEEFTNPDSAMFRDNYWK
jgi:hypothetical protein